MSTPRQNPYHVTSDLIANAVATARVFGENRRICNLVAGSIRRFVTELDDADAADALLAYALECIGSEDAGHVPELLASLEALSAART